MHLRLLLLDTLSVQRPCCWCRNILSSGYTVGYLDVFLKVVVKLQDAVDFSASDGRTVNLTTSAAAGDVTEMSCLQGTSIQNISNWYFLRRNYH